MAFNLSVTAQELNNAVTKANAAAPQSTTYTKAEVDARIAAQIADIIAGAPQTFDTLKEVSDWISTHEDSAAAMNTAIQANADAIDDLNDTIGTINTTLEGVL